MCGRFGLTKPGRIAASGLLDRLAVDGVAPDVAAGVPAEIPPRYNIAPSQPVLAVLDARSEGAVRRTLAMLRWGLVPRWAKDSSIGNRLANARAETVAVKPAFRDAWARARRCAILADVFYEWQDVSEAAADPRNADPGTTGRRPVARAPKPGKQPWAIRLKSGEPFALAGLWESWRDPERTGDAPLVSCTLITTSPNALMRRIHDRMPVVLTGDALVEWVDRETSPERAAELLEPYDAGAMEAWRITTRVNAPANDDPAVLEPLE